MRRDKVTLGECVLELRRLILSHPNYAREPG